MPTNAELAKQIEAQSAMMEEMKAELTAAKERMNTPAEVPQSSPKLPPDSKKKYVRPDHPKPSGAWVVTVDPVPYTNPKTQETKMVLYNGVTHGIKFINGRGIVHEETPDGDAIVRQLEGDFGYKVATVTAEELFELQKRIALEPIVDDRTLGEKLSKPLSV